MSGTTIAFVDPIDYALSPEIIDAILKKEQTELYIQSDEKNTNIFKKIDLSSIDMFVYYDSSV